MGRVRIINADEIPDNVYGGIQDEITKKYSIQDEIKLLRETLLKLNLTGPEFKEFNDYNNFIVEKTNKIKTQKITEIKITKKPQEEII